MTQMDTLQGKRAAPQVRLAKRQNAAWFHAAGSGCGDWWNKVGTDAGQGLPLMGTDFMVIAIGGVLDIAGKGLAYPVPCQFSGILPVLAHFWAWFI